MKATDVDSYELKLSQVIVIELEEAKANDICQLDVRKLTDITDFMVIASGTSHRHVHAMADRVRDAARRHNFRPIGLEGELENNWILIDFSDVVVHLMMPEVRHFYSLERLWNEHLTKSSKVLQDDPAEKNFT
ncbi:MAG: ribosome silencing factor [Acidiferrobacteraceae bacterium]|nr:ribosome silencing factor [Acidiferrobacteraceae bacterium]|tara:strand:- start:9429 stop:9827 length:399 start_codon:yes stop_codon:yes gene_type:complete